MQRYVSATNINVGDDDGDTALHYACMQGELKVVRLLLLKGAIQKPNNNGATPLAYAKEHGRRTIIKLLNENKNSKLV